MTDPTAEEQARAEAELRGDVVVCLKHERGNIYIKTMPINPLHDTCVPALNIDTAEGREAAMELLGKSADEYEEWRMTSTEFFGRPGTWWAAGVVPCDYGGWRTEQYVDSPAEAIKAAWYSYVESRKEKWDEAVSG